MLARDLVVLGEHGVSPEGFGGAGLGSPRMLGAGALAQIREVEGAGDETALGTAHSSLLIPVRRTLGRQS